MYGQSYAAGDHYFQAGAGSQQVGQQHGGLTDLLEVVQQQEQLFLFQEGLQEGRQGVIAGFADGERLRNGRYHLCGIVHRGQGDDEHAIGEVFGEFGGQMQAQARFAHAARSGKCD